MSVCVCVCVYYRPLKQCAVVNIMVFIFTAAEAYYHVHNKDFTTARLYERKPLSLCVYVCVCVCVDTDFNTSALNYIEPVCILVDRFYVFFYI